MKYKYIFFDLDGTLTDPQEGITNCVRYALEYYGINETDYSKLMRFIGPPLVYSFQEYYGFDKTKALEAVEKYRERFSSIGLFENKVYDGIYELLQTLTDSGHLLVLATSKPRVFAEKIMAKYRLRPYFKMISGSELDGTRNDKNEVIEYAIEKLGCPRDKIIMVGDRKHDILGAKKCGVASCGVRFGYAEENELENAGADYIADTLDELLPILMQ
ncbi:MAG: HAD family hydrolase [Clostridia bacterium]|nr:HAD family hydrolase [Clostridia bacterium]MCI8979204.1 HAD family hydrolase [Clostridia bacterium]MCI9085564.1 HAD family hydrolase [Clostridia bacterium]NDO18503.1 HAD family hydrolase [Lachnospiraceae bacterium MD329]